MATSKEKSKKGSKPLKSPKEELFAWLYAGYHNKDLFGNGTRCYMQAYGFNDEIDKLQEEIDTIMQKKGKGYTVQVEIRDRRIRSRSRVATTLAGRLLAKVDIKKRCSFLMSSLFTTEFMDEELTFVAGQRGDLNAKVSAIREHNRLKGRIEEKIDADITYRWGDPEPETKPRK